MVLDEAELGVEGDVLSEVAHGVVRLGAEDRADLVDALEDAHHLLLVELRALRQEGRATEVVDLEDVGPGLGGGLHELRCLDLGVAGAVEGRPEASQRRRGQLPLRPLRRVPPGDRRVVEQRGQRGVELRAPQLDRRGGRRLGQRGDHRLGDLDATGRLGVRGRHAHHLDRGLLGQVPHLLRRARPDDDLRQAGAVADDEEGQCRELAASMDPALEPDRRSGLRERKFCVQGAFHDLDLQWTNALEVWAGARSRCHHTFAGNDPGLSSVRRTRGSRLPGSRGRVVRPHVSQAQA